VPQLEENLNTHEKQAGFLYFGCKIRGHGSCINVCLDLVPISDVNRVISTNVVTIEASCQESEGQSSRT
jgi:hypothetical protein